MIVKKYVDSNGVKHEITASCEDELYSIMSDIEMMNIEKKLLDIVLVIG